jgi:hypothetical protein
MPKQLIIESCLINRGTSGGIVAAQPGELVDLPADTARTLASIGRTRYVERKDDNTRSGRYTATAEMLKAARPPKAKSEQTNQL